MSARTAALLIFLFAIQAVLMINPLSEAWAQEDSTPDQVWDIRFEGNKNYPAVVLDKQIAAEAPTFLQKVWFFNKKGHAVDEVTLQKDVIRLRNYYRRRGFVNVEADYRLETMGKEWKKRVTFEIDEQVPIRIRQVQYDLKTNGADEQEIRNSEGFKKTKRKHSYREGQRYETIRKPEVTGQFADLFENMGFAYAAVDIEAKVDTSKLSADVRIIADLGPRTFIDSIAVEGNENISDEYVVRESALKKGEQFSSQKLQEAQQELFNHHLFRFVTVSIPKQAKDSTLNLSMQVRENKKRSVELLAGFGTEEYLRGQVSWTNRNVAGKGHRLTTTAHGSFIEQSLRFDYLFPYVYNTKSSFVISPFGQHLLENNFELLRAGVTNSFIYRYNKKFTASASYEFTKNKELSKRFNTSLPDTTLEYDLSSFQFSSYFNNTFGRNRPGWVIQPYAEVSGIFGLATFKFQKLSIDVRRFTQLTNSTMLAARVQSGSLFNVPTDSLPNNIRFYLGGTSSVRGWSRQQLGPKRALTDSTGSFQEYIPLGGHSMFSFNLEVRQELNFLIKGLGMAVFLDGGQVWGTFRRLQRRPIQFGTGGGFRYQSPIGPIRVDVGYKLNPTARDLNKFNGQDFGNAWDRIGIHLSIGQAF
ncbi:Beta-barrel assembly machine subunit BamA [Fodinibius salinus]|uniref:Beta-barrel assembly machine subunit BamA n=1 Tax=Fodinibius salinus TaxID=860790 RepID=A0A5D3YFD6_9BACT|nr:BamA/TamA family outer membrane protein [Fodinibius salinus]TYP92126.1 Beta-barrel assembly machine subunit BamA [Fodinibius salinus]